MAGPITIGEALAITNRDNSCAPPLPTGLLFFDTDTGTSNTFPVDDEPVALRLMQLAHPNDTASVCVEMVWGCGEGEFFAPLTMSCGEVCLSNTCRVVILPITGRYRLRYTGDAPYMIDDLLVVYDKTPAHSVSWQTRCEG